MSGTFGARLANFLGLDRLSLEVQENKMAKFIA